MIFLAAMGLNVFASRPADARPGGVRGQLDASATEFIAVIVFFVISAL